MSDTIGFDTRTRAVRYFPTTENLHIEIGDIVRQRSGGLLLQVTDVDGENVYCAGFLDPFGAAGLEIVTSP